MSLNDEERKILVGLEIEKSRRTFAEIEILRQAGLWDNIANRLYYAAFHAVSALLINDRHPVGTHQGAVVMLHQHYVKTGILPKEDGAFLFPTSDIARKERLQLHILRNGRRHFATYCYNRGLY